MTERNLNSARGLLNTAAKVNNEEEKKVEEPVGLRVVDAEDESDDSNHSSNMSIRSIGH